MANVSLLTVSFHTDFRSSGFFLDGMLIVYSPGPAEANSISPVLLSRSTSRNTWFQVYCGQARTSASRLQFGWRRIVCRMSPVIVRP